MLTLDDVMGQIKAEEVKYQDLRIPVDEIHTSGKDLILDGSKFSLTDHAQKQFAARIGVPVSAYLFLRENHYSHLEEIMERSLAQYIEKLTVNDVERDMLLSHGGNTPNKQEYPHLLIRTKDVPDRKENTDTPLVRAVLSPQYNIADNSLALQALLDSLHGAKDNFLVRKGGFSHNLEGMKLDLEFQAPLPVEFPKTDPHKLGFSMSNNEVGAGCLDAHMKLYRLVCTNGMMGWVALGGVHKRHLGSHIMTTDIEEMVNDFFIGDKVPNMIKRYLGLQDIEVADPEAVTRAVGKAIRYPVSRVVGVLNRVDSQIRQLGSNAYAILQAFTEHARDGGELRYELEESAGKIVPLPSYVWKATTAMSDN